MHFKLRRHVLALSATACVVALGSIHVPAAVSAAGAKSPPASGVGPIDANPPGGVLSSAPADVDRRVQADVSFRQLVGMAADGAFVRGLIQRFIQGDLSTELVVGTVVTSQEATELRARLKLQDDVSSVISYGLAHPESYGGLYLDPKAGVAYVLFTGDLSKHEVALASFPMRDRLVIRSVQRTQAQLDGVVASITNSLPSISAATGARVNSVGVDPEMNAVRLGVDSVTAQVSAWVTTRYPGGDLVAVQAGQLIPTSGVVGGGYVDGPVSSCTVGFNYHNSTGAPGFFSAGHCFLANDAVTPRANPTQHYHVFNWATSGSTDSLVVPTNPGDGTNVAGWIVVSAAASLSDDPVGKVVCYYGATIATQHCGTRVGAPMTFTIYSHGANHTVTNVRQVDMGCNNEPRGGDSGSPVYASDNHAYGLLSGAVATICHAYMAYTHVQYAMSTWGVSVPY
jgi:hypothetical protein